MCKIICITNRMLVKGSFYDKIKEIVHSGVDQIIIREKDLPQNEYEALVAPIVELCKAQGVTCFLHSYADVAIKLQADGVHMPLPAFYKMDSNHKKQVRKIGVSVHSVEEARQAQRLGANYVTVSHIYETNCKKGLAPKGVSLISEVKKNIAIPVYALGGIQVHNSKECILAGADGICMMSPFMVEKNPEFIVQEIKKEYEDIDNNENYSI